MHTRTRTRRAWSIAVAGSLALAVLAVGGPAGAGGDDPACGASQLVLSQGATTVLAHGTTTFKGSQVDPSGLGGGTLTWSLKGQITGSNTFSQPSGDLAGYLDWTIDWNQDRPNTQFHSSCVGSVQASVGHVTANFDGVLTDVPATPTIATPSGLSSQGGFSEIQLARVRPSVADIVVFAISGSYCNTGSTLLRVVRPKSNAPGHKEGNGGRAVGCG